jgi:two-component system, chemotaxis family, response regulator Rcp1
MEILMVEDSPSDAFLAEQALKSTQIPMNIHTVQDGVEAMAFLHKEGKYSNATKPDIIFLDLNLPRKDGREVLEEIKGDHCLKCIPVIVLSSSSAEQDIQKAYSVHANCYITKPDDFTHFKKTIKNIEVFWFKTVTLPQTQKDPTL